MDTADQGAEVVLQAFRVSELEVVRSNMNSDRRQMGAVLKQPEQGAVDIIDRTARDGMGHGPRNTDIANHGRANDEHLDPRSGRRGCLPIPPHKPPRSRRQPGRSGSISTGGGPSRSSSISSTSAQSSIGSRTRTSFRLRVSGRPSISGRTSTHGRTSTSSRDSTNSRIIASSHYSLQPPQ